MYYREKLLILAFLFSSCFNYSSAQSINFAETSFSNLIKGSKQLDRPLLVYLYTKGCADCLRMEELSFTDPNLSDMVNSHMLAGKLDLQSEDGIKLKTKNKINFSPTILFFDQKGKLLLQQETALNSNDLMKLLDVLYEMPVNLLESLTSHHRSEAAKFALPAKIDQIGYSKALAKSKNNPTIGEPSLNERTGNSALAGDDENTLIAKLNHDNSSQGKSHNQVARAKLVSGIIETEIIKKELEPEQPTNSKIETVSITRLSRERNQAIQLGAYFKYEHALAAMRKMKKQVDTNLIILEEVTNGKSMYKLRGRHLLFYDEAVKLKRMLKNKGIDSFIRNAF